jgi:hypothetical protein
MEEVLNGYETNPNSLPLTQLIKIMQKEITLEIDQMT